MPSVLKVENSSISNINGIYVRGWYLQNLAVGYYGGYVNEDGTIFIEFYNDQYIESTDMFAAVMTFVDTTIDQSLY